MRKDKEPLTDSEGLRVVTIHDEEPEEVTSLNAAARRALEEELAAEEQAGQ